MKKHRITKIVVCAVILSALVIGSYALVKAHDNGRRSGECVTKQGNGSNGGAINNYGEDITICP